jgi:archaellum component FlaC
MPASSRSTDVASELESFLDSNEDDLSPNMFSALNELAGTIDEQVVELNQEITDLKDEVESLKNQINQLEEN